MIIKTISKILAVIQLANNLGNKDKKSRAKIGRNISNIRNFLYVTKK